jgi:transcription antitermination factor NusG
MQPNTADQWFALRVRGRSEKTVSQVLVEKGYESFLPTYEREGANAGQDGAPFFPGYVFCRFDVFRRLPILKTPGVLQIVGVGRAPLPVEDHEILSLQKAVHHRLLIRPADFIPVGQKVRIADGALKGVEGIVVECRNSLQLILSVTLLRRSVRVEIHRDLVMS